VKKPRGRPPLDAADPSVSLTIRLPSKEFDALARRALALRQSLPAIIRQQLKVFKSPAPSS